MTWSLRLPEGSALLGVFDWDRDGRPEIFDLVTAASDVLAYFVNDEHKGFALTATSPQLERAFDYFDDVD